MTEIFSVKREIPRQSRRSQRRVQFFARGKKFSLILYKTLLVGGVNVVYYCFCS